MAEQEACTELVKQASQDQSSQSIDGEFLLLPLLQGLLDAPENEQTHDSGTESGEDQRSGLIAEVQNALDKLSTSLRNDATDITSERRSSLLQLVTKLQAGLQSATSDRRHSGQMRFNRRRERPDRHTIGVSNEELADARKLMQEISCPSQSSSKASMISKQNSDSNVNNAVSSSYNTTHQKSLVKNSTPKPFGGSNSATASSNSSSVQTPSESADCIGYIFSEETKGYHSSDTSPTPCKNTKNMYEAPQDYYNLENTEKQQDYSNKLNTNLEESENESSTLTVDNFNNKPDILMQSNPIYYQPNRDEEIDNKKNRFTTKKLKMRRANTIDIPKPLHFYEFDDDEETDAEEEERRRRSNYLALRGPIRVGNLSNRNSVPSLEPKTENDKKFLAFISKHNQKNQRHSLWASKADKSSIWNNKFDHIKTNFEKKSDDESSFPEHVPNYSRVSDDSVRFGSKRYDPKISKQSAMNLKRMFEEKQRTSNERRNSITTENSFKYAPDQPVKNVRFIPQPLPVNKFSHAPSSAFQPVGAKNFNEKPQHNRSVFKPIPEREVKHEPTEEHPEITKSLLEINDKQGPPNRLFLYSPKPIQSVSPTSPGFSKPWVGNSGESRVLALAAKKFENPSLQSNSSFQPRRLSKEKINAVPNFQSNNEKMTAPYLVKSLEQSSNTVRKLSGQYDNLGYQQNKFDKFIPNKKPVEGFQPKFTVPQNYSIRYERPKIPPQVQPPVYTTTPADVKRYNQTFHPEKTNSGQYYAPKHDYNFCKVQEASSTPYRASDNHDRYDVRPSNTRKTMNKPKNDMYDNADSGKPRYEVQTRVKTEVYNAPRVEIADTYRDEKPKPSYLSQSSVESVKEYEGISSRVMSGPVAQVASMVKQKSPMTRNEHDMQAAFDLKTALQKVSNSPSPNPQCTSDENIEETTKRYQKKPEKTQESNVIFNNIRSNREEIQRIPNKPSVSEHHEMTAKGEHIVTGKLPLPPSINVQASKKPTQAQVLSKSDSWHQICLLNQGDANQKPAARSSTSTRNIMKSKSTHSMIPPKQFEAGMSKDEILEKRRTMEAFFGGGSSSQQQSKSPSPGKVVKRAINRTKTSEKNVQYKQMHQSPDLPPIGLARSRTLPDIVCLDLLDENNVDQAFEDLFTSS